MTPEEHAQVATTRYNSNSPAPFPGRTLFEKAVADAVRAALADEREALLAFAKQAVVGIGHDAHGQGWIDACEVFERMLRARPN